MRRRLLKYCNWSLLMLMVSSLFSGVFLETTGGIVSGSNYRFAVYFHIVTSLLLTVGSSWHIMLHFGSLKNSFTRLLSGKRQNKWLATFLVLSAITGAIATAHWTTSGHSSIGGFHGKIALIGGIIMVCHVIKRLKFYTNRITN